MANIEIIKPVEVTIPAPEYVNANKTAVNHGIYLVDTTAGTVTITVDNTTVDKITIIDYDETWTDANHVIVSTGVSNGFAFKESTKGKRYDIIKKGTDYLVYDNTGVLLQTGAY